MADQQTTSMPPDLALQVAQIAQERLRKTPPAVPARGMDAGKAPELPPKRPDLRRMSASNDDGPPPQPPRPVGPMPIPQRNVTPGRAPPVPIKPQSVQNSPKVDRKPATTVPTAASVQSMPPLIKPRDPDASRAASVFPPPPARRVGDESSASITTNGGPAVGVASVAPPAAKPKKPDLMEELGSEDALRGIESGLRNMERAMQEQLRNNMESRAAAAAQQRLFNTPNATGQSVRSATSFEHLESDANLRMMEKMRLSFEASVNMRSMERNLSMDQMRLEGLQNCLRSMESNPNLRTAFETGKMKNPNAQQPPAAGPPFQFRSLDRHLPLELQYSRHRAEQLEYLRQLDSKKMQLMQHQQEALQRVVAMRRRSSHDETPFAAQNIAAVSRLREQWDDATQNVLQRKSQLSAMLGDSQRYEAKRLEIEAWLTRMETRAERFGDVATTADVLDAQQKEQKSFHAELHQYKHQIELFNTLTQKLIAVYPTDDTSRIKRMTESVNLRYNNLTNLTVSRGKMLHSAIHSLQTFDRQLDQFLAWLSEAESLCENTEAEIERNPMAVKTMMLAYDYALVLESVLVKVLKK